MHAIIIDTETTAKKNGEVVELAYAEVDISPTGVFLRNRVSRLHAPRGEMEFGALATHHILPATYAGLPHYDPATAPPAEYYIGHNIDFDWEVLGKPPCKRICTLALSRKYIPECDSHSQSALMYFLTPRDQWEGLRERLRSAHSAESDILFCAHILAELIKLTGARDMEHLYTLSEEARIPERMTFGKFKDQHVCMVDGGWRAWYYRQSDPDPYVLQAFKRYPYTGVEPK